jgi:ribosome biogenesis GTPase
LYRIATDAGEFSAEPSGALWHRTPTRAGMPVVGDWVEARIVGDGQAIVEAVLPRRTLFSRRAAGRREDEQPIAANIDVVFLVCGLDGDFNLRRLERYLALAQESSARPVVVLNKADLCDDLAARITSAEAVSAGAAVVAASTRSEGGLDALRAHIAPGATIALLGSSGVGKSSIVNALVGVEHLRTAEVREDDSRGRHTTTHRELISLPGGAALIDTPGMRELQLWASEESVDAVFDEIAEAAAGCRYRDCTHSGEPGCAVEEALRSGALTEDRLRSYRKLQAEARHHELMADPIALQERNRKWKVIHKAMRKNPKQRS